jgi:hypothetical protein
MPTKKNNEHIQLESANLHPHAQSEYVEQRNRYNNRKAKKTSTGGLLVRGDKAKNTGTY